MVFEAGLEPAAFRLSGERSNQLSYTNIIHYLEDTLERFELPFIQAGNRTPPTCFTLEGCASSNSVSSK